MSLYTARTIGGGADAIGTTLPTFRLGLVGPTFYNGSADPTVTPPTPMDDGFSDGDIYIRGTTGGSALWVYDTAVWTQIASGAGGGSFAGDIIMVAGAQLLGDPAATAAAPAFAFNGDEDTGMFQLGADELGFSTGGTQRWRINATGDLLPTAIGADIATSPTRLGTVYATTFDGTATAAQHSDLAERYTVGHCCAPKPGDVVVICDHEGHDICCSLDEADDRVLGVVSTKPAFMMNSDAGDDDTAPYIALRGRVPVKVYGLVRKGDLLITSDDEGCARALTDDEKSTVSSHAVFAKALSYYDADGIGEVEAVIL